MVQIFKQGMSLAEKIGLVISFFLRATLLAAIIISPFRQEWLTLFLSSAALLLTFLPAIIRRNFKVYLPVELEFLVILFVYASLYLGEIHAYYTLFWWWDLVLHSGSSILLGITGFILVYVLNQEKRVHINMRPGFVALFAFTFALAIGATWEIFEFGIDGFFGLSMQKSGLVDTMWDMIVNAGGALLVAVVGYFYVKGGRKMLVDRFVYRFVKKNPNLFKK